jgi:hypothetical protein
LWGDWSQTARLEGLVGLLRRELDVPPWDFKPWLPDLNKTEKPDRFYWHVKIRESMKSYCDDWTRWNRRLRDCEVQDMTELNGAVHPIAQKASAS